MTLDPQFGELLGRRSTLRNAQVEKEGGAGEAAPRRDPERRAIPFQDALEKGRKRSWIFAATRCAPLAPH